MTGGGLPVEMKYDRERALQLLRKGTEYPGAEFRDGQEEAIRHILERLGKLLVVQKTGWGKSFVYFIAAKLLREAGAGPSLLISPLLSLMRNQIAAAERMGVRAVTINSTNPNEWDEVEARIHRDEVDILLISPERLANNDFSENILPDIARRVPMLVIDEAHCISDWGHDFRPDYRRIERIARTLPQNVQLLGTTATANDRVLEDLVEVLGPNIKIMRGDLNRPSLLLQTIELPSKTERLAWLAERLADIPGSGIIYTLTIRDAEQVARWLQSQGLEVQAYSSRSENREELEKALLDNSVKALAATTALGMGYDKPDLTFVIHYQMPGSVVAYYQQVGRAGRGVDAAYGVLLSGSEDTDITDFFIDRAFPTQEEVRQILGALDDSPNGLSVQELLHVVNVSRGRIGQATNLLALESPPPIVRQGSRWQLTAARLSNEFWRRAERLVELRHGEQRQMREYLALRSGHMEFLVRALDGNPEAVRQPDLPPLPTTVQLPMAQKAAEFLRRTSLSIEPRKQWASRGPIPEQHRAQTGRALCAWGDGGWARLVRSGKYEHNHFSDELVVESIKLIREWSPRPAPEWVTCVPSRRHSTLVKEFAEQLATGLGLPFRSALVKTYDRPEQKAMANSVQQARNIEGSLAVEQSQMLPGQVILVDDMVDSRWTFTFAAWLLRTNGSGEVWPFALADTGNG